MKFSWPALWAVAVIFLSGCHLMRTEKSQYTGTEEMLARGDYPSAITRIESAKDGAYKTKDRVLFYLDMGMLHHWNGDYQESNRYLEMAERAIEENFTKSISTAGASLLLNDNVLPYAGEDYEDIYLNLFKALNYLALNQNDDAFVEVRRINNKLHLLSDKYNGMVDNLNQTEETQGTFRSGKSHFQECALGRYLSLLLYRQERKWDDVRIDSEKITKAWNVQPRIHPFERLDLSAEQDKNPAPPCRLNIIAFSGQSPDKTASALFVHTEENIIVLAGTSENYFGDQELDGLNLIPWPGINAGYHFKFQLPSIQRRPSYVRHIEVSVSGTAPHPLEPIESLENAAAETFSIRKPIIYLKTLTRAVSKGLATERAKQRMTQGMGEGVAFITRLATDLVTDQTENADLRISRFFPAEAAVCELHLDEGIYDIQIDYYDEDGGLIYSDLKPAVSIVRGKLNLLESAYLN